MGKLDDLKGRHREVKDPDSDLHPSGLSENSNPGILSDKESLVSKLVSIVVRLLLLKFLRR